MKVLFHNSFWTMAIAIATNISMLKAVERSGVWSLADMLLRALLVAQLTCLSGWFCQRRVPAALQAIGLVALALLGVLAGNFTDQAQSQLWCACLLVHLASVNLTYGILIQSQVLVRAYLQRHRKLVRSGEEANGSHQLWAGNASQITIRKLFSLTSAFAVMIAAIVWTNIDQHTLSIVAILFGCCGLLSALNIWSSSRCERSSATMIAVLISAVGGGLLKLCGASNQHWLTASLLFVFLQLSICCGILIWRALAPVERQRMTIQEAIEE